MPAKERTAAEAPKATGWTTLLIRNTVLWMVPVAVIWWFATPVYNRMLVDTAAHVLHLFEHPPVTELPVKGDHEADIVRKDFPPSKSLVRPFRVTDVHFHLLLLCALFLAVPRLPWRERLENLTIAFVATVIYDVVLVVFIVEFNYATQLGPWSLDHYGAFARNFFGLGKHLLDLPFKLALPLLLWCAFYLPRLRAAAAPAARAT